MRTELGVPHQLAFGSLLKQDIDTGGGRQTVGRLAPTHQDAGPRSRNTRPVRNAADLLAARSMSPPQPASTEPALMSRTAAPCEPCVGGAGIKPGHQIKQSEAKPGGRPNLCVWAKQPSNYTNQLSHDTLVT